MQWAVLVRDKHLKPGKPGLVEKLDSGLAEAAARDLREAGYDAQTLPQDKVSPLPEAAEASSYACSAEALDITDAAGDRYSVAKKRVALFSASSEGDRIRLEIHARPPAQRFRLAAAPAAEAKAFLEGLRAFAPDAYLAPCARALLEGGPPPELTEAQRNLEYRRLLTISSHCPWDKDEAPIGAGPMKAPAPPAAVGLRAPVVPGGIVSPKSLAPPGVPCPNCGKTVPAGAADCPACGIVLAKWKARSAAPVSVPVKRAPPITRMGLNVTALIGVFIFGWLIGVVFDRLGRRGLGWTYVAAVIGLGSLGRQGHELAYAGAAIVYFTAWIHANLILSGILRELES